MAERRVASEGAGVSPAWHLARPAVAARLGEALDRGSLLVVAGAGFGKTTALGEVVGSRPGSLAWVRCGLSEGDPGRLLELTVDALKGAAPGVADALSERLAAGVQPIDVRLATTTLTGELERLLVDPLTLVFDEAEGLEPSPESVNLVRELAGAGTQELRIAVNSRVDLGVADPMETGAGRMTAVGPAELAFTLEECVELERQLGGDDGDRAAEVWAATEGWPIAVVLAILTSSRDPAAFTPGTSLTAFLEGLIEPLPAALAGELVDSSVAADLTPELLRALGLRESLDRELARLGLPCQLHGEGGGWSYHPLVRDFLKERLERTPRERQAELHRRCARALDEAGRGPEAVEHWLEAEAPESAAMAVLTQGSGLARTAPGTVKGWIDRLPEAVRAAPPLSLLQGRLAAGAGDLEGAVGPLRRALEGIEASGDEEAKWLARLALADTLAIAERFDEVVPLAEGYDTASSPAAPAVAVSAAAALAGAARYPEASELFENALAHPLAARLEPLVQGFRGFWVDLQCGRLDAALAGLREAVAHLEREDPFDRLPYLVGMEAVVREERGEDRTGLRRFEQAREMAAESMLGGYIDDLAHRFAAGVHARAGRLAEAETALAAAGGSGVGWYAGDAEITRATIAAGRGSQDEAAEAVEAALAAGAMRPWRSRWRNTARLVPVLVTAGRRATAGELVDEALTERPERANCARLLSLRAWLRALEGDSEGSDSDLRAAWEEAGAEATHLVRRELPHLRPLLWRAVESGAMDAGTVIDALSAADRTGEAVADYARHPLPAARADAAEALVGGGTPLASPRLAELEEDADPEVAATARACLARVAREPPPLVFRVLGGFSLRRGAYPLGEDDWAGRRRAGQRLVRYLLAHRPSAVTEDGLFEAFWPDREAAAARRILQVTVSSARAALDVPGEGGSVLAVADRTYRLELGERDVVDADDFERSARQALAAEGEQRAVLLSAAAASWTGEPLPEDRYENWAIGWRERLFDLQRRVLEALTDSCFAAGDLAGAVEAARRWVEIDPRDESAQRALMTGYARTGRRGHALRQYILCRRTLIDDLGIEPGAETADLQRKVLAGERL